MKAFLIPLMLSTVAGAATPAYAQDPAAAPSAEAVARLDDLEAEIDEFVQSWRSEQMELQKKYRAEVEAAEAAGEPAPSMPAMRMRPDFDEFVARLMGWAEEVGGEDAALYYTKVVQLDGVGEDSDGREALDRLVADHADSPSWARLGDMLPYLGGMVGEERAAEVIAALRESPDGNVRGWVVLLDHADTIENAEITSELYLNAKQAVLAALEQADDERLRSELQGSIDLREKFGIGALAPDIVGVDLDGVAFKLSDYKGKVVFLDFWGDW